MSISKDFLFSEELRTRVGALEYEANKLMIDRRYDSAREVWLSIYTHVLTAQEKENRRIHKGGVLFQLGILALLEGNQEDGIKYMLKAYIEDILSYPIEIIDQLPAAKALAVFGLKKPVLTLLKERLIPRRTPVASQPRMPDDFMNEVLTQSDVPLDNVSSLAQRPFTLIG